MKELVSILAILLAVLSFHNDVHADSTSAAEGWFNSSGWQNSSEKGIKNQRADMIKRAENGYYDGFNTYTYYISSTTVGNQTNITNSEFEGVAINSINCAPISGQNSLSTAGGNRHHVDSQACHSGE